MKKESEFEQISEKLSEANNSPPKVNGIGDNSNEFLPNAETSELRRIFTKVEAQELPRIFTKVEPSSEKPRIFKRVIFKLIDDKKSAEIDVGEMLPTIKELAVVKQNHEKGTGEKEKEQTYGNFIVELQARIRELDKKAEGYLCKIYYLFLILLKNGEEYFARTLGSKVDNLEWITEFSGGAAYINPVPNARKQVLKMIHTKMESGNYKNIVEYRQNGWKQMGKNWRYVIDSGTVGESIEDVLGDYRHTFPYLKNLVGDRKIFNDAMGMLDICQEISVTLPLFLYAHMGVLCKLFELAGVPIKYILAIIGPTNSKKTSMALCMTKTFGREDIFTPQISFEATLGGIEVESSLHPDSVLLIDDFHPTVSKKGQNRMDERLEFILRRYGDRTMKKRMVDFMPSGREGSYEIEGLCVITGEDISGVQSSLTRVISLEVQKNSVKNQVLSFYQNSPLILTTHLYDFISYVTENFETLVEYIKERTMLLRQTSKYEVARFCEYFAQMIVAAEIIAKYAVNRHFWNEKEAEKWVSKCAETVDFAIQKHQINVVREDYATLIVQAFKTAIEEQCVCNLGCMNEKKLAYDGIAEDDHYFYAQVEFLMEITKRHWMKLGKELPFSSKKQLTLFLEQKDLILVRKEGEEVRRTLPIPKGKQRVLYIKKDKMRELLDEVEL